MIAWLISMLQAVVLWGTPVPARPTVILIATPPDGSTVRRIPLPDAYAQIQCDKVAPKVDPVHDESDTWKLRFVEQAGTVTCHGEMQSPDDLRTAYRIAADWTVEFTVDGLSNPRGW